MNNKRAPQKTCHREPPLLFFGGVAISNQTEPANYLKSAD